MVTRLVRDMFRSLTALAALVVILAGAPWALTTFVGWPLPAALPTLDELSAALGGASISDSFIVKTLAVACWLLWAQVVICFGVELVAWAKGRTPHRVALAGGLQPLVRHLVVSATILLGVLRPVTAGPHLLPATATHAVYAETIFAGAGEVSGHLVTPVSGAGSRLPACTVQPRDSLWQLAEEHLGDGMRWRELWELNRDQPQPDGLSLREPDLIQPGWVLHFPEDAIGLPAPLAVPSATPEPLPVPSDESSLDTPAPAEALPPTTKPTKPSPTTTLAETEPDAPQIEADDGIGVEDDDRFPVPAALAGATLMAAGVISTVTRMRARQQRQRHPGHTIPIPKGEAARAEHLLRRAAAVDPANRLDIALRVLAHQLAPHPDAEIIRIEAVRLDGDRIEMLLTEPIEAEHGPFEVIDGRAWALPEDASLDDLLPIASQQTAPTPALVTVGHLDGCQVLIDLEAGGLVVGGDSDLATGFFWSLALELATCAWADDLRVVMAGRVPAGIQVIDRVELIDTVAERAQLLNDAEAMTGAIGEVGVASRWLARLHNAGDAWAPTVLLVPPDDGGSASDLQGLIDAPGIVVVRWEDGDEEWTRRLLLHTDGFRLEPLGLELEPVGMDEELVFATSDLVATAASDEPGEALAMEVTPPDWSADQLSLEVEEQVAVEPGSADDPDRILVRILGPVEIEGGERPVDRRRVKEFIVFLTLHPRGVTEAQIKDALWPDQEPTRSALNQTVSRARTALGTSSDGKPHIPYFADGLYRPGPHLVTDWQLLEVAWKIARLAPNDETLSVLAGLLHEVRGLPFASTYGHEWAYELGLPHRISAVVDELRIACREGVR